MRKFIHDGYSQSLSDTDLPKNLYSGTDDQFLDDLAQHIVNKTEETLNYKYSPFWNTHRKRFLSLMRSTEISYCEKHIKEAAKLLLNEGLSLFHLLEETKKQLSLQHGVPYSQPATYIERPDSYNTW